MVKATHLADPGSMLMEGMWELKESKREETFRNIQTSHITSLHNPDLHHYPGSVFLREGEIAVEMLFSCVCACV